MPLAANVPEAEYPGWRRTTCPICGAACWETDFMRQIKATQPDTLAVCAMCAVTTTHVIKLELMFCDDILSGVKTFEVRFDDRDYQVGDRIRFEPVEDGMRVDHPVADRTYKITYLLRGWGLAPGYVAFAIKEDI